MHHPNDLVKARATGGHNIIAGNEAALKHHKEASAYGLPDGESAEPVELVELEELVCKARLRLVVGTASWIWLEISGTRSSHS